MNANDPFWLLSQNLSPQDTFFEGCKKIASFIRKTEERFEAPKVAHALLYGSENAKEQEHILFCLLDVSRADFDILDKAVQLRQLRHLISKATWHPESLKDEERDIFDNLNQEMSITSVDQVVKAAHQTRSLIAYLAEGHEINTRDRQLASMLLIAEANALKARGNWLSEHVDAYNMRAIARLLPLLTVCDEQTCTLTEIGERILQNRKLGRAVLTFEYSMRTDSFEKWKKKVGKKNEFLPLIELLQMQRSRLVPVRNLVSVATLTRAMHPPETPPLKWIRHALSSTTTSGFRIETGEAVTKVRPLLDLCNTLTDGTLIYGDFSTNSFLPWVGMGMLTRVIDKEDQEPAPKELIARCMTNDALMLRLLENPKIYRTPGLIAFVAYNSRSLAVLQKIARTRELYTGYANNQVPLALLKNPAHIPLNQIRHFINIQYVPLNEMKSILHNPYGIRPEIYAEIKDFVERRYR